MDETIRLLERQVRESPDDVVAEQALERARCRVGRPTVRFFEWKTASPSDIRFAHPNIAFDMAWLNRALRPGATAIVWGVRAPSHVACSGPSCRMCPPMPDLELPPRFAFVQPHRLVVA